MSLREFHEIPALYPRLMNSFKVHTVTSSVLEFEKLSTDFLKLFDDHLSGDGNRELCIEGGYIIQKRGGEYLMISHMSDDHFGVSGKLGAGEVFFHIWKHEFSKYLKSMECPEFLKQFSPFE